ncbi:hypothetical protein BU24DRAFT_482817 [Aaosphaeria arxii CBS 175.79]|uniref:Cyanovirin-N domain-containing protein n=1 Tax=Aaosphaeria arxii CBS 175.79 TaxID=1450172 RepID=A0A6A5XLC3_9PLEO|nr:uncharacterized protein BU24DRAFT_482817 [Aaosphaeria arxii CBS 175.79]KAF2013094.1 hypothetical protein BU24DRAFT_482817 [Aaosphaeria arxii CBS 175.79]
MIHITAIAILGAFVSDSISATVTLEETPCIQQKTRLETLIVRTDKLEVRNLPSLCGLKIISAAGANIHTISCIAFKDEKGEEVGSARFTFDSPALIATNPVQVGSLKCDTNRSTSYVTPSTRPAPTSLARYANVTKGPGSQLYATGTTNITTTAL